MFPSLLLHSFLLFPKRAASVSMRFFMFLIIHMSVFVYLLLMINRDLYPRAFDVSIILLRISLHDARFAVSPE